MRSFAAGSRRPWAGLLLAALLSPGLSCATRAPEFEVVDAAGLERALRAGGVPRLANFWATWCAPCLAEMPELAEASATYEGRGLETVAVSLDLAYGLDTPGAGTPEEIARFAREHGIELRLLVYDDRLDPLLTTWDLPAAAVPFTLAFDAAGQVTDREIGPADRARFEELARRALGE